MTSLEKQYNNVLTSQKAQMESTTALFQYQNSEIALLRCRVCRVIMLFLCYVYVFMLFSQQNIKIQRQIAHSA
jgi:hypothetical protein